jgi:hypothetical protein
MGRPAGKSKFCWVLGFRSDEPTRRYFEPDEQGNLKCTLPTHQGECKYVVPIERTPQSATQTQGPQTVPATEPSTPTARQLNMAVERDPFIQHERAMAARAALLGTVLEDSDEDNESSDDDDGSDADVPPNADAPEIIADQVVTDIFKTVLAVTVAKLRNQHPAIPPPRTRVADGTRNKQDRCAVCTVACQAHRDFKAYVECSAPGCAVRASASHEVPVAIR